MPPPVTLASSTRQALRRITAKDPIHPAAIVGKFWDQTESDCEELGDADALPRFFPRTASAAPAPPITGPSPAPAATATACQPIPKPSPRRVRLPLMTAWKGPLPPPRITPLPSIGDFISPALQRQTRRRPGVHRPQFQIPNLGSTVIQNRTRPKPTRPAQVAPTRSATRRPLVAPHKGGPTQAEASTQPLRGPRRRVVNPTIIDAAATCAPSYLEVLMAGGDGGRRGGRGAPGSGGADRRRGRGRAIIDDGRGRDDGQGHRGRGRGGPMHNSGRGGPAPSAGRGGPPPAGPPPAGGRGNSARGGRNPRHAGGEADKDQGPNSSATEAAVVEQGQAEQEEGKKRKRNTVKKVCTICTDEHFTNLCPLLRGPKPSVALCGAAEDGMGFFQIQGARNNQIVETSQSSIAALVTVKVGKVSAQLLQAELARIIPVRWDWEVQQLGANSYVVPFPSKEELDRMIAIDTINTKNKEGTISFAEFVDDVQPIKVLEQVWLNVTGVPRRLRSFLSLWAVGTIVGATQKVDMVHLRATGQARILVAVFDPKKIPGMADVCVGTSIYRLFFKAEEDLQADTGADPSDEDLLSDKDLEEGDREMEDAEDPNPQNPQDNRKSSQQAPQHTQNVPPMQQANLVDEALDLACEQLLDEISLKVALESDLGTTRKSYSPPTQEELAFFNSNNTLFSSAVVPLPSTKIASTFVDASGEGGEGFTPPLPSPSPPLELVSLAAPIDIGCGLVGGSSEAALSSTSTAVETGIMTSVPAAVEEPEYAPAAQGRGPAPPPLEVTALMPAQGGGSATSTEETLRLDSSSPNVEVAQVMESTAAEVQEGGPTSPLAPLSTPTGGETVVVPASATWGEVAGTTATATLSTQPGEAVETPLPAAPSPPATTLGEAAVAPAGASQAVLEAALLEGAGATSPSLEGASNPTPVVVPIKELRRSTRNATLADIHTLHKAERLTAKKNLEFSGHFQGSVLVTLLGPAAA
ncbi:uncharacterized protein [Miscanthus floridulus]|uniref:uncharacterized protein n=4 Tax=Miscanthus floridulus TaxID=154761 RepID=UPI00345980AC